MNRVAVAQELVKLAKDLTAVHPTPERIVERRKELATDLAHALAVGYRDAKVHINQIAYELKENVRPIAEGRSIEKPTPEEVESATKELELWEELLRESRIAEDALFKAMKAVKR